MIERYVQEQIEKNLFNGKIILLFGARQTGKTTLLKNLTRNREHLWLTGDEYITRTGFSNVNIGDIRRIAGEHNLIIIDEAQRIPDIGLALKLFSDNFPNIQVITTGSSAFELAQAVQEPLTGRKRQFHLFPLSFEELCQHSSWLEETGSLNHRLIFGSYPEVVSSPGKEIEILNELTESYLYKDILLFDRVKKPELLRKILEAIALQTGNEVAYYEIGQLVGADSQTVERYIALLEQAFVVFRLPAFSRNMRNEIKKSRKIYFYDTGVRNSIIRNFNPLELRLDTGPLWENWIISERLKRNRRMNVFPNTYFWRTVYKQEIDYIEDEQGKINAYEIKWQDRKKGRCPISFTEAYPDSDFHVITTKNYSDYLLTDS